MNSLTGHASSWAKHGCHACDLNVVRLRKLIALFDLRLQHLYIADAELPQSQSCLI